MKKTRLIMLVGVMLLSLALVGMALAADSAQKHDPPVQVAFTGTFEQATNGDVQNISGSFAAWDYGAYGNVCSSGGTDYLCFTYHVTTNSWSLPYGLQMKLQDGWNATNGYLLENWTCAMGGYPADLIFTGGNEPVFSQYWYLANPNDTCEAVYCMDVTTGGTGTLNWYINSDGYGGGVVDTCDTGGYYTCDEAIQPPAVVPACEPGLYLSPDVLNTSGCNGIPQIHTFTLFNNTGDDGTFDLTYTAPAGMAELTGPDELFVANETSESFDVTLTPDICNFDPIVATIEADGNGYTDTSTIYKEIVNEPSFETIPNSAPSWAGFGYPRDGCTAMNADGDWVSYEIGDTSGIFGFWGYNTATNTWFQPAPSGLPADRWAPDWAYDPDTNLCYMTGGANTPGGGTYNEAYVFDPIANTFTQLGSFTSIRDFHNSWVGMIDGVKYLCLGGGVNASGLMVQSTQCYDLSQPAPGTWNGENAQMAAFPTDPFGAADGILHAATGDQFWYVGGAIQAGGIVTDEARYWDDADNAWHQAGNTGYPRYRVEGDFFDDGQSIDFYQLGGSSGGFTPTTDVAKGHFDGTNWVWTLLDNLTNQRMDNIVGITPESIWSIDGYGASASAYVEHAVFCPACTGPLEAEKTATEMILPGDTIDYAITIFNTSESEVPATMLDAIPAGTTYVPGSVFCDSGVCGFDGSNVTWEGIINPAGTLGTGNEINSLTGSYVAFDPAVGGDTCFAPGEEQTFCFRSESFTPDYAYVYDQWQKFPADWTVLNVYVQGTPFCESGSFGSFSWSYWDDVNETDVYHPRYQSTEDHCVAYYCYDVLTGSGSPYALESWYWAGDDYGNPPDHPCSDDGYTPSGEAACDEAINPQAAIPPCSSNTVTINFQVVADGVSCPSVVENVAVISSEGNPDVYAVADTDVYCAFEPDIVVSPLSLYSEQIPDTITTQQLEICNEGPTALDWSLTEVPGLKVNSITPSRQATAINLPANVSRDPAIEFTPIHPTADLLLDQAPNQSNVIFSDASCDICGGSQVLADNFTFEDAGEIEQIVMWTGYYPGDVPIDPDVIRVMIHQDAAGIPGAVVYDESNISYDRVQTGVILFGVHEWMHTLTLNTPAELPAGTYWLEIYNDTGFGTDDWFWEVGDPDTMGRGNVGSVYAFEAPGAIWYFDSSTEQSLQLYGTIGGGPVEPPDVLLLNADDDNDSGSPIQIMLQGYGDLGVIDLYDARYSTPSLAELQAYDVVVVWSNYVFFDSTAIGNVLADYVDAGGKVIDMLFALDPSWGYQGRFRTEGYSAMTTTGLSFYDICLGTYDPYHPIMAGVTDVCEYFHGIGAALTAGSSEVARFADDLLFVAVKDNETVATINGYVGYSFAWTGQEDLVLHNAILWLAGGEPSQEIPWLAEVPTEGTVEPLSCVYVDVSFDSTGLDLGSYFGTLDVNSNDPDTPVVPVDVQLDVIGGPDIVVSPLALDSILFPDQQETQDLNICNEGELPLDWSLVEAAGLKVNSVTPVPATNFSHPVELSLEANGISMPTAPAPAVPQDAVELVLDDGSRDNDIGIGGTLEFLWVNRFTPDPADYPFRINEVWVYFSSVGLVNVGDDIKLVFYENINGTDDPAPGSSYLGGYLTTVQALDQWNVYVLPDPMWFNGPTGDAIIGVIGLEVPGTSYWPASIDQTASQHRSWAGWWNTSPPPDPPLLPPDADWTNIDAYFPGNWMVRGYGETGQDALPWLSENPTEGTVDPGECVIVNVTFDSTGMEPSFNVGTLNVLSNDPDTPEVSVDVTLTVVAPVIDVQAPPLEMSLLPGEMGDLSFTIGNLGDADLEWSVTDGAAWLSEDPTEGTVPVGGDPSDVMVTFDATGLTPGEYTTDVVITSNDPATPEVTLPATLTVETPVADLAVTKTASADEVRVGEMITYTLVVSNAGPQDAMGVTLMDTLPELVSFVWASDGCTELEGVVTCDIGDLAMDEDVTLYIVVSADVAGLATNMAEVPVPADYEDPNLENNMAEVDTMINPAMYYFYLPIIQKH